MNWLRSLLSAEDRSADSIIVGGLAALVMLFIFTGYSLYKDEHHEFAATSFALACGTILGAIGGSKMVRDKITVGKAGAPTDQQ